MTRILPFVLILAVAGCARSEEASLVPPANQGGPAAKVANSQVDDREPAIGQWRSALQENAQILEFGPMGAASLFSMACTGNRSVMLQRHGGVPAGPLPAMQVSKGEASERFDVINTGGPVPMLRAEMSLQSPLAEALAATGDPLLVRLGDDEPLVLPANALIGDYLRSCATARPQPGGNSVVPAANNAAAPANGTASTPAGNSAQPVQ